MKPKTDSRLTTTQRGYGHTHQQERAKWEPLVTAGQAICWRCQNPIDPSEPWDLGHDDHDPDRYAGPEHPACNRGAGGRNAQAARRIVRRDW